ncbi:QRFP-like peptide receptor [Exaiptasia diaphana]|uniref:G-protein coupled receptors family 1 profile domain-containing protein n=1 Tax=Exaiptasia diaphana TaxID=2652724 RepID=A0A913X1N7_EXADI|nr:QRFP-like peptide receptor [Exaiptasia diaphana]
MNHTTNNSSKNCCQGDNYQVAHGHVIIQATFGVIAVTAFLSNGLLCYVILRNRRMLSWSYNVFIFSLALTDMITGVFVGVTPGYIISLSSFQVSPGLSGEVFCRVIGSQYIVYSLGKASAFTVTCMAIERWYSVVRPIHYRVNFSYRRVTGYLCLLWFLSLSIHSPVLFEMTVSKETQTCIWESAGYSTEASVTMSTIVTFFIPIAITWASYLHIAIKLKRPPLPAIGAVSARVRVKLARMCMLVAFLLTTCWFPNQVYYVLSSYGLVKLETPFHRFTIVLVMFNSCVNPSIYCFSNQEYKRAFLDLWRPCLGKCRRHRNTVNTQETQNSMKSLSTLTVQPAIRPT